MQVDALQDGYTDHELFSLSAIKVCSPFTYANIKHRFLILVFNFLYLVMLISPVTMLAAVCIHVHVAPIMLIHFIGIKCGAALHLSS